MRFIYLSIVLILLGILGCKDHNREITKDEMDSIIQARTSGFEQVLFSGELDKRMDFYDEEASISPNGFEVVNGKENIKSFLAKGMEMAKFSKLDLKTDYINGNRDFIYQMGLMDSEIIVYDSLRFDNSSKFFYLWKLQEDGSYRIIAEVTSTKNEDDD